MTELQKEMMQVYTRVIFLLKLNQYGMIQEMIDGTMEQMGDGDMDIDNPEVSQFILISFKTFKGNR